MEKNVDHYLTVQHVNMRLLSFYLIFIKVLFDVTSPLIALQNNRLQLQYLNPFFLNITKNICRKCFYSKGDL